MGRRTHRLLHRAPGRHRAWPRIGLVSVLVAGIALSTVSAATVARVRQERAEHIADERVAVVTDRLERRLHDTVDTLESLRPLWALEDEPTRTDFARLLAAGVAEQADEPVSYDGLPTIGFVRALRPGEAGAFLARRRAELPGVYTTDLRDDRPHYVVDFHSDPASELLGMDVHPFIERREAMEQARDQARAVAMPWDHAVSDRDQPEADRRYVSTVFVPVYAGTGAVPDTLEARRTRLIGWLASSVSAAPLLDELADGLAVGLRLRAPDGGTVVTASVGEAAQTTRTVSTEQLGRTWSLDLVIPGTDLVDPALALVSPWAVLLLGLCVTLLVAALLRVQLAANDRAERRADQATRELRRSEVPLRLIAERVPVGIVDLDQDLRVRWVNSHVRELLGASPDASLDAVHGHILASIHRDDVAEYRAAWDHALAQAQPLEHRHRFVDTDGNVGWVEVAATPILDEQGDARRWLLSINDVTDMARDAEALQQARDDALESSQVKSAFLANMSHEIRTPLNGVIGMAGLLLDSPLSPDQREQVVTLRASAEELLALLGDILDLSRIESGRLTLESVPFAPAALAEGVIRQHASAAFDKGLELRLDTPETLPAVLGDPVRVRQVLHNLVGNAVKFTRSGRVELTITGTTDDDRAHLTFSVADTGPGIPVGARAHIFEAFAQADPTTTREFGGSGLGLSICRQLADLMDGDLTVDSVEGVGSRFTFTVTLPATDDPGVTIAPFVPPALVAPSVTDCRLEGMHVLLAEDNAVNQQVALSLLTRLGITADLAADGVEALEAASQRQYDAVLMDCQMPRMDGYEATRRLRAMEGTGTHTPVIAMTAAVMSGDRERCLAAGMNDYVPKPVLVDHLRAALQRSVAGAGHTATDEPEPATPALLDTRMVGQLRQIPGLFEEVSERYLQTATAELDRLHAQVAAGDWHEAGRTTHRVRGSSATVGAARLAELLLRLEDELGGTPPGADVPDLLAECADVLRDTACSLRALAAAR